MITNIPITKLPKLITDNMAKSIFNKYPNKYNISFTFKSLLFPICFAYNHNTIPTTISQQQNYNIFNYITKIER